MARYAIIFPAETLGFGPARDRSLAAMLSGRRGAGWRDVARSYRRRCSPSSAAAADVNFCSALSSSSTRATFIGDEISRRRGIEL